MTKVFVACAGSQEKWKNHRGVPSHLVKDRHGETILDRTLRLVTRMVPREDVYVFSPPDDRYQRDEIHNVYVPEVTLTEFHTTREYWGGGRNVLLLGDVWFTPEALEKVLSHRGHAFMTFGRSGPSKLNGSPWGEIFGYTWFGSSNWVLDDTLARVRNLYLSGKLRRFTGWELLYSLQGATDSDVRHGLFPHNPLLEYFTEIDDLTDDIDFPQDLRTHPSFRS